jgi:hypothetical protein
MSSTVNVTLLYKLSVDKCLVLSVTNIEDTALERCDGTIPLIIYRPMCTAYFNFK